MNTFAIKFIHMKYLYASFFFMLLSCYTTTRQCANFKTGRFYSQVSINGVLYESTFERNKTLQVEDYKNKIDSTHVRWINDCEVVFRTINPKSRAEQKDIHLKILTTTDSSYTFEYSYVGEVTKQQGVAYKFD